MSGELDIGQIPDRPATPSTSSEMSEQGPEAKPRVARDEDLADGETKPPSENDSEAKSPTATGGTDDAPRKKNKRPTVDYVRPEATPSKVRSCIYTSTNAHSNIQLIRGCGVFLE